MTATTMATDDLVTAARRHHEVTTHVNIHVNIHVDIHVDIRGYEATCMLLLLNVCNPLHGVVYECSCISSWMI